MYHAIFRVRHSVLMDSEARKNANSARRHKCDIRNWVRVYLKADAPFEAIAVVARPKRVCWRSRANLLR